MMIIQLMKLGPQLVDTEVLDALNEIFKLVTNSKTNQLKSGMSLTSLLFYEDERDPKMRQEYESVVDEMSRVSFCVYI